MKTIYMIALVFITMMFGVMAENEFVVVGETAIEQSLMENPTLEHPVILMETGSESVADAIADADVSAELEELTASPFIQQENEFIKQNQETLSSVELLAHQLGVPVYSELAMDKADHDVSHIEHSLVEHQSKHHHEDTDMEMIDEPLDNEKSLLEHAPIVEPKHSIDTDAETDEMEHELNMVELSSYVSPVKERAQLPKQNDYAYLDDPKHGGHPTVMKNLQGLDIYIVNQQVADNDNEIRPVKPPHPMSAAMRERARQAELMRKQLIHDIPQPKASIKPKTRINTLSAYEPSLVDSRPLKKVSRLISRHLDEPLVGGHGAMQLKGIVEKKPAAAQARFAQLGLELPGTAYPTNEPAAAAGTATSGSMMTPPKPLVITVGKGSSFDNRDGPPVKLDDLLPLKAQLVEELDPLHMNALVPKESEKNGW